MPMTPSRTHSRQRTPWTDAGHGRWYAIFKDVSGQNLVVYWMAGKLYYPNGETYDAA